MHYFGPVHLAWLFHLVELVKANDGFSLMSVHASKTILELMDSHFPLPPSSGVGNASLVSSSVVNRRGN